MRCSAIHGLLAKRWIISSLKAARPPSCIGWPFNVTTCADCSGQLGSAQMEWKLTFKSDSRLFRNCLYCAGFLNSSLSLSVKLSVLRWVAFNQNRMWYVQLESSFPIPRASARSLTKVEEIQVFPRT
jgi:hypothetical protein